MKPQTLKEALIQPLLDRRELKSPLGQRGLSQTWQLCPAFVPTYFFTSFWVYLSMNHSCVSWWTLLNSNYCIKPIFSVVRAARSSQTQLWSIPSGSRSKLELLCRLCWRLALSDNHFKERCSGKREAKQKSSRLWWMWPTGRHVKLVGSRKQQGRPGGCHMVSLSFGAWSSGAVSFNISQPLMFRQPPSLQLLSFWLIY